MAEFVVDVNRKILKIMDEGGSIKELGDLTQLLEFRDGTEKRLLELYQGGSGSKEKIH